MSVTLPAAYRTDPEVAERVVRLLRRAREKALPPLDFRTPGHLAAALDPSNRQTPALDVIDQALVDTYTQRNGRLIISMPPQEGKSQRATKTATLWNLIRNPELRCGVVSYSAELATTFGRDIRTWITTYDGTQGTLDLRLRIARNNNAAARWQLDGHKGGLISVGIGGSLTGRPIDALVIDDPFAGREDSGSPAYREKVWQWYQSVATTRLAPGAPIVLIMTRWHEDDLAGRLLKHEDGDGWRVINIPAQADHDPELGATDPLGRQPGEWMVSARDRTPADFERTKIAVGTYTFSALYQGRPSPDAGDVLQKHWWRRYQTPLWSTDDGGTTYRLPGHVDEVLTSWDMTFKDTKGTDYVVGQVWARVGPDAFLLDQVRARMDFTATLSAFLTLAKRWPQALTHLVEDKANGPAVISAIRNKVSGAVIAVPANDSKQARTSAIAPFVEAGNVHLPDDLIALFNAADNSPADLIREAAAFPNDAHDDQVDAASQALHRFFIASAGAAAWAEA
ncbi:MAG: phage terminase large subunit, partial [Candidatus Lutacidiplasmatales archaeon]